MREHQYVVLEGDWGGQIYLTAPLEIVPVDDRAQRLLETLDRLAWSSNHGNGAGMRRTTFSEKGVSGGMGGGAMIPGTIWVHRWFRRHDIEAMIRDILRINATVPIVFGSEK